MSRIFPPSINYPYALDDDYNLFVVYNTTETMLSSSNTAWSLEIDIVPVNEDDDEIWADNGFANLEGELLYYDSVEKDEYNKVIKLKNCARNIGGKQTCFRKQGTVIRSFVIAEHHNQLVQSTIATERFLKGIEDQLLLLAEEDTCKDDAFCPDVDFNIEIDEDLSNDCDGIIINYTININGNFSDFILDFGDGRTTTNPSSGSHTFPKNTVIDPIVKISNNNCTIIQSPLIRDESNEPQENVVNTTTLVPIPQIPDLPTLTVGDLETEPPEIEFPQFFGPCIDLNGFSITPINIPSVINFGPVDLPSIISFGPVGFPSVISFGPAPSFSPISFGPVNIPSIISFGPGPNIPSIISFGPAPSFSPIGFGPVNFPSIISFGPAPNFPSVISFGPAPNFPSIISFGLAPSFSPIAFGPAPSFSPIGFGPAPNFPSIISFGPAPSFSPIGFGPAPNFPSIISFGPAPSFSPIGFGPAPNFPSIISFGSAPSFSPTST